MKWKHAHKQCAQTKHEGLKTLIQKIENTWRRRETNGEEGKQMVKKGIQMLEGTNLFCACRSRRMKRRRLAGDLYVRSASILSG